MQQPPGYGPPQGYPQGYPPPQKQGLGTAAKILIGLVVICVLGFGGCILCIGIGAKGVADQQVKEKEDFESQDAISVSADELLDAYESNEVAADAKYKGKKVRVTGKLSSIGSGFGDEPLLQLGSKMFPHVSATGVEKSEAARLTKGQDITLECKADGEIASMPQLTNCSIK